MFAFCGRGYYNDREGRREFRPRRASKVARIREETMKLPSDGAMLLSYINTKLRDEYDDLDALCDDLDVSREELEEKLGALGYRYDTTHNKFTNFFCSAK